MELIHVLLSTLSVLIVIPLLRFFKTYYRNKNLLRHIASPPEKFFFGHLYILTSNADSIFQLTRKFSKDYYPLYRFTTLYVNIVNFVNPNDIEQILSSTKHLSKSKVYTFLYKWLGTGLLTSTGAKWHKRRKVLTPAFHFSILLQFLEVFNNETEKLVKKLSGECGTGTIINVIPPVTSFTLQSIAETAMGLNGIEETTQNNYKAAIYEIGRIFMKRLATPWYRLDGVYNFSKLARRETEVVKVLHDFSRRIIREREEEIANKLAYSYSKKKRLAMLDLLVAAKRDGADIDFEGIREEVDTFMFEGHDTTSMAISFILLVLANLQDVQTKVLDEILTVLGPLKLPSFENLQELRYTERVIKETLRLFPSVPLISRYCSEEFITTTGHTIPKNTVMHVHIFDVHRSPEVFPDPLKFDPDRFLPENVSKRHPFAYIPFSAGPRNCIGQKFAFLELKAVLCGVLRRFRFEKVDDMNEVVFRADLVLRPSHEIRVKIYPRLSKADD